MKSILRRKSPVRRFQTTAWFLAVLACTSFFSLPLPAKSSANDPFKKVTPPTSEWQLRKVKNGEIEIGVKGKVKAINIGLRIQKDLPIAAGVFLDQVRTQIMSDPNYKGSEVSLVNSQTAGGKTWDFFVIKRKDQVNQEFWVRSFTSDQMLIVLYTAVGNYYEQYRNDFLKVLQQAAGD